MSDFIQLEQSWQKALKSDFSKDYYKTLMRFLTEELNANKNIYPPKDDIFNAFNLTPFNNTKVVILGQDPYHGQGQAHGLCFSVQNGIKPPPSLKNIYKEIGNDLSILPPSHGNLSSWAKQGVLLLNTVLTVEEGKAGSHQKKGWEIFTDKVIELLNEKKKNLVFILWGSPAQKKGHCIDETKHLVLKSVHPSPLSAHRGFFNNNHFSKTNEYLISKGIKPIDWKIPDIIN